MVAQLVRLQSVGGLRKHCTMGPAHGPLQALSEEGNTGCSFVGLLEIAYGILETPMVGANQIGRGAYVSEIKNDN